MEKLQKHINLLVNSRLYFLFLTLLSFIFVLIFSRSTSPLYAYVGFDAACFKQMGMAILNGKTIYVDYFDNKGCLLFFIHALCLWLGGDWMIMILQAISLTISLIILDKIIYLYKTGESRLYIIIAGLVLLACFYEGGDLSEEWSLPFICYPLYVFLKSIAKDEILKQKDMFAIGLCFGVIGFLRINNAIPFCGFLVCLFVKYIVDKRWKDFFINALLFLSGIIVIAFPCFLYFYLKAGMEGVNSMVYATFISGFKYLSVLVNETPITKITYYLTIILFLTIQLISSCNYKNLIIPVVIAYMLFLFCFGTKSFVHYQMIMIPLYVLCLSTFKIQKIWLKYSLCILCSINLLIFLFKPLGFLYEDVIVGNDKFEKTYAEFHEVMTRNIPDGERDSIYNYNTDLFSAALLYNENLIQTNPVLFTRHNFTGIMTAHKISEERPLWVMICKSYYRQEDLMFLHDNYEERFVYHYDVKYYDRFGVEMDIYFFRRK